MRRISSVRDQWGDYLTWLWLVEAVIVVAETALVAWALRLNTGRAWGLCAFASILANAFSATVGTMLI